MSRFGRNYIQIGQYIDYLFPMYNIRFIALTDNIDTANSDSASMDMMPIMNLLKIRESCTLSSELNILFLATATLLYPQTNGNTSQSCP